MKICSVCNLSLPIESFSRKGNSFQSYCKSCHAVYRKSHYEKNRTKYLKMIQDRQEDLFQFVLSYKVDCGCVVCKEKHPACLDLHHRNPDEKEVTPALMWQKGWSKQRIQTELDKCDVMCANCHRKYHWRRGNAPLFQSGVEIS